MTVRTEFLPNEPILMIYYSAPVNPEAEFPVAIAAINKLLQDNPGVCYEITHIKNTPMTLDMIIDGLAMLRRVTDGGDRLHMILVTDDEMVKLAASWATQPQYGGFMPAKIVTSEEEALAYVRAELAKAR
jgi:hypothetical protein